MASGTSSGLRVGVSESGISHSQTTMDTTDAQSARLDTSVEARRHPVFRCGLYIVNLLLLFSVLGLIYSTLWEYSTRRYLKGFSDAIVPASVPPEQKIEAILGWMARGPARRPAGPSAAVPDRDPTETLNYNSLLQVCGTATNAFVNLADSSGLATRRLLLLDSNRNTKHVVAEVFVDRRWIIVDPTFRTILRSRDGTTLTREDLANPFVFAEATHAIPEYDATYTFERTAHVRLARLRLVGVPLRRALDLLLPGWEDSSTVTLLLERDSLAAVALTLALTLFLGLFRILLRSYGEKHLGIHSIHMRDQLRRAFQAFVHTTG